LSENVQIRKIDLNLFRVFDAVMQQRSVSRAAKALSVTPSAISHSLSRLRAAIDDDLFFPGVSGMQPTPRAVELASKRRLNHSEEINGDYFIDLNIELVVFRE
jgi:hypothetical protein